MDQKHGKKFPRTLGGSQCVPRAPLTPPWGPQSRIEGELQTQSHFGRAPGPLALAHDPRAQSFLPPAPSLPTPLREFTPLLACPGFMSVFQRPRDVPVSPVHSLVTGLSVDETAFPDTGQQLGWRGLGICRFKDGRDRWMVALGGSRGGAY